jgi:hypothetical protein
VVAGEWLTTQTYNGGSFIELVQPVSGQSMFHDYLAQYPAGGTQLDVATEIMGVMPEGWKAIEQMEKAGKRR